MRRAAERFLGAFALVLLTAAAHAQLNDVPPPPRLDRPPEAARPPPTVTEPPPAVPLLEQLRAARPPNAARLAPLPAERADAPDEVVVIGSGWRLPDLGSAWREEEAAENPPRLGTTLLPVYDPDTPETRSDLYLRSNPEAARVGYIDLFRVRFGRKRSETDGAR